MKILITSDVHIHDFRAHNTTSDSFFRLHQFQTLADRMIDIIHGEHCEAVCIAGDLIHVASPRPYIVNAAQKFLKKIAAHVPVYVTHGQHDYDSRTSMNHDNSLLSVLDNIDNVSYIDHSSINLGGRSFYFQGWTPDQDFSHIPDNRFDILIGHATVDDAVINDYGTRMPGQTYQNDKFKLCFMGDIHRHQVKGNQVIPGVPIQNNFGDAGNTGVIVLDTQTLFWKRIAIDGGRQKFLKFVLSTTTSDDPLVVTKPPPGQDNSSKKDILSRSLDINQIILDCVTKEDLTDIHKQVFEQTDKLEDEQIDIDFSYEKIVIQNFRSIDLLEWSPARGVSTVNGQNGTGKSSLLEALRFGELGDSKPREFVRHGCDTMSVDITRTYQGVRYRTVRGVSKGTGFTKFFIDDKEVQSENQPALKARIETNLRYLSMYDIMHHSQDRPRFLSSYSYQNRVDLISRVIGLSIVDKLKKTGERLRSGVDSLYSKLESESSSIDMFLKSMDSFDFSEVNYDFESDIAVLSLQKETVGSVLNQIRSIEIIDAERKSLQLALEQYVPESFDAIDNFNEEDYIGKLKNVQTEVSSIEGSVRNLRQQRDRLSDTLGRNDSKIQANKQKVQVNLSMSAKIATRHCYACGQDIDADKHAQMKHDIETEIRSVEDETANLERLTPNLTDMISKFEANIEQSANTIKIKLAEISNLEHLKSKVLLLSSQKQRYKQTQDNLKTQQLKLRDAVQALAQLQQTFEGPYDRRSAEEKLSDLTSRIAVLKEKKSAQVKSKALHDQIKSKVKRQLELHHEISALLTEKTRWDRYVVLMSPNGSVTRSVLTTLSDKLSNETFKVIAFKTLAKGETRPDFSLQMNVPGIGWIGYDALSGGQRTVCDIFILYNLISVAGGSGLLVLDETLGQLDPENLEFCVNALQSMPVRSTFIVTHHENFPYSDQTIIAKLENGVTRYSFN